MKKGILLLLIYLVSNVCLTRVFAQEGDEVFRKAKRAGNPLRFSKELKYTTAGISLNAFNYFGDLAPRPGRLSTDISFTKPGIGLVINHRLLSRVFLRGAFTYGSMQGDDFESADLESEKSRDRYDRNLHFKNNIFELSATVLVDILENRGFFVRRAAFTPYIFAGIGALHHNPKAKVPTVDYNGVPLANAGQWVALQPLGTEGQNDPDSGIKPYKKIQFTIPVGFGARIKLNNNFDLAFELGYRILFFDYIDDVSDRYPDYDMLKDDLARTLSGRAGEPIAAVSGKERDQATLDRLNQSKTPYVGKNGNVYTLVSDNQPNNGRGDRNDKDIYVVTSIQLTYVLGSSFRRPKYR